MHVGYIILDVASESVIDESWCLLDNKLKVNAFINGKYLPKTRDTPERKYLHVHFNAGVTSTNKIGDFPVYQNHF